MYIVSPISAFFSKKTRTIFNSFGIFFFSCFFFSHGDDRISVVVKSVSHDCVTSYVTAVVYDVSDGHTCWCMCVNDVAEVFFLILK